MPKLIITYTNTAFPYEILDTSTTTLKLQSNHDRYDSIYIGVGIENEQSFIQVSLPPNATFGDKGKANEFCRFSEEIRRRVTII